MNQELRYKFFHNPLPVSLCVQNGLLGVHLLLNRCLLLDFVFTLKATNRIVSLSGGMLRQKGPLAHRALLVQGTIPRYEFTLRVVATPIKGLSPPAAPFHQMTFAPIPDTRHSQRNRSGILALRVSRAGKESPTSSSPDDHVGITLLTFLSGHLGRILILQRKGISALGESGTGHEPSVTSPLDDHHFATFFTCFVGYFLQRGLQFLS